LNEVAPKRIVATCPHCLHTLKNEYPAFGGEFSVVHHTQLINELIAEDRIKLKGNSDGKISFHDPCYLGRQNGILAEPRSILQNNSDSFIELPRHGSKSFCCGAGGGQMWKEEEEGRERVSANRMKEAASTGADTLAVACPFCLIMLADAAKEKDSPMRLLDIAEIVAEQLES
jgi:Fe-S oxidoreductase